MELMAATATKLSAVDVKAGSRSRKWSLEDMKTITGGDGGND